MKHQLIKLPYGNSDLSSVISAETIEFHHGKHLQGYVNNLNGLIEGTEFEHSSLEDIVRHSSGSVFNNAGQIFNHNLYFLSFSPNGGGAPKGKILDKIVEQWGSFELFQKEFVQKGVSLFGSGWIWLSLDQQKNLVISQDQNGSNPLVNGNTPLLGFDVWEHAYYLDYRNRRVDHLTDLWKIVDWKVVEDRYLFK